MGALLMKALNITVPNSTCRPDMADHVLRVLKVHVVKVLAAAIRTARATAGDADAIRTAVEASWQHTTADQERNEVALLICVAAVDASTGLPAPAVVQSTKELAAHIDFFQRRAACHVGSVIVVPAGVVMWSEVRQHLLHGPQAHAVAHDSVPVDAQFVTVPSGKFCRYLFFSLLRLQGVMGVPIAHAA